MVAAQWRTVRGAAVGRRASDGVRVPRAGSRQRCPAAGRRRSRALAEAAQAGDTGGRARVHAYVRWARCTPK